MRDIHNHILFGIDDGSNTIEESIEIIKEAYRNGYTDLIITPHYRQKEGFTCDNKKKREIFEILKKEVKNRDIDVNLYLGNEITLDDDFFYFLETDQILSLNDSRYILLELPFVNKVSNLEDIIDEIKQLGLVPIIAHPERYRSYRIKEYQNLIRQGVLFQGNISSLYGKYGNDAKQKIEEMLKLHMIHFFGSDTHHNGQTSYSRIKDVTNIIEKLTGDKNMALDLVDGNIDKVIKNESILPYKLRQKRRGLKIFKKLSKM